MAAPKRHIANTSGSLFDVNDFAPLIETALRTDTVLQARFLTIRTGNGLRYPQGIVCPALSATRFRVTTFWIWHDYSTILISESPINFTFQISNLRSQISNLKSEIHGFCTLSFILSSDDSDSPQLRSTKHKEQSRSHLQLFQLRPARIHLIGLALAFSQISIAATDWTQSPAIFTTQHINRN
jgi:hypothetical protein